MPKKTDKVIKKENKPAIEEQPIGGIVKDRLISEEMRESYLDYAMSVIVSRALPDVRDGLKPVHRRILYAMWNMGLKSSAKFRKSAAVVGEVLGKYHPHGDQAVYESMVRMAQDFSMRYQLVWGQGNFGCFTKDTKVKLVDGRDLSFEELIKEHKRGKINYTYTVNRLGLIAISEIKKPRLTRKKVEIIKVVLDNDIEIKCTPNHLFMMRDGSYKEANDLKPNDSLMPCYQKKSEETDRINREGYTLIYQNKKDEWVPVHHLADNYNLNIKKYAKNIGRVRHHIDFNKLNNNPNNIIRMGWKEHWQTHYNQASLMHKNEAYRKKIADGRKKYWSDPINREKHAKYLSERNIKNWKDTAYREKMVAQLSKAGKQYMLDHPERRQEIGKQTTKMLKRLWKQPEYRALMHEKIIKGNKNHTTNKTGRLKFVNICKEVVKQYSILNKDNYFKTRCEVYPYGCAPLWETGLNKYFQNDIDLVRQEINGNHKVVGVKKINKKEDVYDLTIDNTHNFCLAAGIFVHNSQDGDSAAAARYCITGDSLILTDKGILPIEEISDKEEEKINLGVLNFEGKEKKASKFFNSGKHNIIKVVSQQGYKIAGSYNHPILVWQLNKFGVPDIQWKLLEDVSKDDYVMINRNSSLFSKNNLNLKKYYPKLNKRHKNIGLPQVMNKDLAFLLGALVSEGSFHNGQILFNNQDMVFYNKVKNIIKSQFKDITIYEREVAGNCMELSIYHQKVVLFLENIGFGLVRSDKKEVPFSVLESKKEIVKSFLSALFEGDGSAIYRKDKRHNGSFVLVCYDSKSLKLIKQLKILLLNFGVITNLPIVDKRSNCLKLSISGVDNVRRFKKEIDFFSDRKRTILARIDNINPTRMSKNDYIPYLSKYLRDNYKTTFVKKHNFDRYNNLTKNYHKLSEILNKTDLKMIDWLLENRFFFDKIKTVEKPKKKENVYSVKVESKCHTFIANGFINHNTEAKLKKISDELLFDIDKDTVDLVSNYDGSHKEPKVLPAKLPTLLLNGTMGIAVGMSTNIPPHNLVELIDGIVCLIDNPNATVDDLMEHIKGPDFPTGGIIYNKEDIKQAYATGKGGVVLRGKTNIEENKKGFQIIISEVPYQMNKASFLEKIAGLVKDKKIEGIRDLRDESNKEGVRVVVELKRDSFPKKVLNQLFSQTGLQTTFHFNVLALVDGGLQPRVLNLKMVLEEYIKHRQEVVTRRTQFELNKAKDRAHILEGLMLALNKIDAVIKTIKASKDRNEAKGKLIKKFKLSERQADAILEMKLSQLANLERLKIETELKDKKKIIAQLTELLKSPKKILGVIKDELAEIKERFGDERRTKIVPHAVGSFNQEDLIPDESAIVVVTRDGYIKRLPPETFKTQSRGGKGVIGLTTKEEDVVEHVLTITTHQDLLFFTTKGRVFELKAYEVPVASRTAKGQSIVNFLQLAPQEKVSAVLHLPKKHEYKYLTMVTRQGTIKKCKLDDFKNIRRSGLIAIKLKGEDLLEWVKPVSEKEEVVIISADGKSIRFKEKDIRCMGRSASGVRGIRLKANDVVIGMNIITEEKKKGGTKVLIVTSNGFGKMTDIKQYRLQSRGGSGIKTAKVTTKNGKLVWAYISNPDKLPEILFGDLLIISDKGQVIRLPLKSVPKTGRDTQGVRLMRFKEKEDHVASVTLV